MKCWIGAVCKHGVAEQLTAGRARFVRLPDDSLTPLETLGGPSGAANAIQPAAGRPVPGNITKWK